MKLAILLISLGLIACVQPPPPGPDPYQITMEEVAFFVGCIEMGEHAHVEKAATKCADLSVDFLKRHRRPRE